MTPYYQDDSVTLYHGDCLDMLADLADASVDAVVTDPPYGLEFMGKEWDAPWQKRAGIGGHSADLSSTGYTDGYERLARPTFTGNTNPTCRNCGGLRNGRDGKKGQQPCRCDAPKFDNTTLPRMRAFQQWCELWTAECLRVLKPGGHLLAFGGTRTSHRLACAVEDAGFEIRDSIAWLHAQGFPKSMNVTDALGRLVPPDARCVCGPRSTRTPQGSPGGYPSSHGSDDGQPQSAAGDDLAPAPSPAGALARSRDGLPAGGPAEGPASSAPGAGTGHPSIGDSPHPSAPLPEASPPSAVAQSDMRTSTSGAPVQAPRRTADHTPHTSGLAAGSASSSPLRNKHMACPDCGLFAAPQGLGTTLKPAFEPVVVARKPLAGTVAANVLTYGTGALNVDACRIEGEPVAAHVGTSNPRVAMGDGWGEGYQQGDAANTPRNTAGRWPANVVLDESQAEVLDEQSGDTASTKRTGKRTGILGDFSGQDSVEMGHDDQGGASRFFYTAKADAAERPRINGTAHPTVKPLSLMRWLVRLVTPPGGTVLDPFAGSGTTIEACILEHTRCIGIEREDEYLPLIEARIARRLNPVRAVELAGDDAGLFGLLDDGDDAA